MKLHRKKLSSLEKDRMDLESTIDALQEGNYNDIMIKDDGNYNQSIQLASLCILFQTAISLCNLSIICGYVIF